MALQGETQEAKVQDLLGSLGVFSERASFKAWAHPLAQEADAARDGSRHGLWHVTDPRNSGQAGVAMVHISSAPVRYRALEAELARAALLTRDAQGRRLFVVNVPSVHDGVVDFVRRRAEAWAPDAGWLVVDEAGAAEGAISRGKRAAFERVHASGVREASLPEPAAALRPDSGPIPWTDSNILLAKWLFLDGARRCWKLHEAGLGRPPRNPLELAEQCGVSRATAYRFVDAFVRAGLIRAQRGALDIADPLFFLDRWVDHARQAAPQSRHYPVQWLGGVVYSTPEDLRAWWNRLEPPPRTCAVAGYAATSLAGWLHLATEPLAALHWTGQESDLVAWMEERTVVPVEQARDAHFWIVISSAPRSIAALARPLNPHNPVSQVWLADPLQMIVDVIGLPRGEDQAERIVDRLATSRSVSPAWV